MKPTFQIRANEKDITALIADRLIDLRLVDEAGMKSDQVTIKLDNRGDAIKPPSTGAELQVALGYEKKGLFPKGLFTVDEIELSGPVKTLTIRAKAAKMRKSLKAPKSRSFDNISIGDLVATIAKAHGYEPKVAQALASVVLPHIDQTEESDMHLLTRLARERGAVFKPAGGNLVFVPRGEAKSATGKTLTPLSLTANDVAGQWRYTSADRGRYEAVEAKWRDVGGNQDRTIKVGSGKPVYRLRNAYPDSDAAATAAKAKLDALQRGAATLNLTIIGRGDAMAEAALTVSGFNPEVDGISWTITRAEHQMSNSGYTVSLQAEAKK